jgi:hypothetical protein
MVMFQISSNQKFPGDLKCEEFTWWCVFFTDCKAQQYIKAKSGSAKLTNSNNHYRKGKYISEILTIKNNQHRFR